MESPAARDSVGGVLCTRERVVSSKSGCEDGIVVAVGLI